MGPSGSGKSTLLHCLAGLDTLTSGHVFLGDIDLSTLSEKELTQVRRDRVGFIFQTFNLIPTLTALENITLPMALAGRKPDQEWLDRIIDTVGLARPADAPPVGALGRPAAARRGRARARRRRPRSIFADEPTGNLDSRASAEILGFMQQRGRRSSARRS